MRALEYHHFVDTGLRGQTTNITEKETTKLMFYVLPDKRTKCHLYQKSTKPKKPKSDQVPGLNCQFRQFTGQRNILKYTRKT